MGSQRGTIRVPRLLRAIAPAVVLFLLTSFAQAQGPQFDVGSPPGAAGGASAVGQPLGQANFPDFETPSITPFSGKVGIGGSHVPISGLTVPGVPVFRRDGAQVSAPSVQPMQTTQYGDLQLDIEQENYGLPGGLTLDAAIELLVKQNLDLVAARLEIPMSEADVLTANLRANPIFYADTQLIPYGHFSFLRPGGPPQSDLNINYPLDITFKRLARTNSAREARNVTEAQLQDFVRNSIDNLYTVYEDDVSAGLTVKFSEVYANGIRRLYALTDRLFKTGQVKEADLLAVNANVQKADLQVKEAKQAKIKANRALASDVEHAFDGCCGGRKARCVRPLRQESIIAHVAQETWSKRPYARGRTWLLSKSPSVAPSPTSGWLVPMAIPTSTCCTSPTRFKTTPTWACPAPTRGLSGVTATIPLYNRNQGNVTRAKINMTQSEVQAVGAERGVIRDVLDAAQELEQSKVAVNQFRKEIIPTSRQVRDTAYRRWQGGEVPMQDYLDAQQDFNDMVRQYRDAMIRHRRAILDLNTAVGERVLP